MSEETPSKAGQVELQEDEVREAMKRYMWAVAQREVDYVRDHTLADPDDGFVWIGINQGFEYDLGQFIKHLTPLEPTELEATDLKIQIDGRVAWGWDKPVGRTLDGRVIPSRLSMVMKHDGDSLKVAQYHISLPGSAPPPIDDAR